jgi:putative transposase
MRYIELNPVRAGMAASPASYAWSSHGANALGRVDELITPQSLYESLGTSPDARQARYRSELMRALTDDELRELRDATQFEWALGGEDLLRRVEAVTGRRTARLPMGPRPGSLSSNGDLPSD